MHGQPIEIRYSTGELAQAGDQVDCDGWLSVVEAVISTQKDMNDWGVEEPGLMMKCMEVGLVFQVCDPLVSEDIVFQSREK